MPAKIPQSALTSSYVDPDNGTRGGYTEALENALTRCQFEIIQRLEIN